MLNYQDRSLESRCFNARLCTETWLVTSWYVLFLLRQAWEASQLSWMLLRVCIQDQWESLHGRRCESSRPGVCLHTSDFVRCDFADKRRYEETLYVQGYKPYPLLRKLCQVRRAENSTLRKVTLTTFVLWPVTYSVGSDKADRKSLCTEYWICYGIRALNVIRSLFMRMDHRFCLSISQIQPPLTCSQSGWWGCGSPSCSWCRLTDKRSELGISWFVLIACPLYAT